MGAERCVYRRGAGYNLCTSGAGSNNNAQNGITIDRKLTGWSRGVCFAFFYDAAIADTKKFTLADVHIQQSATSNMGSPSNYCVFDDQLLFTGDAGNSTVTKNSTQKYYADLGGAKRYIRIVYTPKLDRGATDTAAIYVGAIFDEPEYGPQT